MNNIRVFVVHINENMYRCFFNLNSNLLDVAVNGIDNRRSNKGLPVLYNQAINESLDQDSWLFFVHEDFEINSNLSVIGSLERDCVYGTFGVRMVGDAPVGVGAHTVSHKDGRGSETVGVAISTCQEVETLDCQSILIHTSLLRKYPELRFDENLTFDLYAEDFCIMAKQILGLKVMVFPLDFQHYSFGKVGERYHRGLAYLAKKYPDCGVPGSCSFIGGKAAQLEEKFKYDIEANRA